jgi:hypothetical protein
MDKRLIIIPIILVIGSVILLSGIMNTSDDNVPDEVESDAAVTEEPEVILQSADINDSEMNETILEEAPATTPNLGGMGGGGMGGGGAPASKPVDTTTPSADTTTPSADTDADDEDENEEDTEEQSPVYTFYIKVE